MGEGREEGREEGGAMDRKKQSFKHGGVKLPAEGCTEGGSRVRKGLVLFDVVIAQALCTDDALQNRKRAFIALRVDVMLTCAHDAKHKKTVRWSSNARFGRDFLKSSNIPEIP